MNGVGLPQNFSRFPLLWLSIAFVFGVVASCYLASELLIPLIAATLALTFILRRHTLFVLSLLLVLGSVCAWLETASIADNRVRQIYDKVEVGSGELVELEGLVVGVPEPSHGGMFLRLRAEKLTAAATTFTVSGYVRFFIVLSDDIAEREFQRLDLGYGSRTKVYARLMREELFRNPGSASRVEQMDRQGIDATATVKSPLLIEKLDEETVFLPLAWVYEQRRRAISGFREIFSAQTGGVMIASLLGDQHFLDHETADVFREGGTFHVLVISGLHITFIGAVSVWLLSFITRREPLRLFLAAIFLWAYTLAVGAEVPVVRAALMFSVLLLSRIIYRSGSLLNSLGLSILLLLAFRPSDLFSPSFQLTVTSVGAIVACSFPLIEKLRSIGRWMPDADTPFPPNVSKRLRRLCEALYWNETHWEIENARHVWSAGLFKAPYLHGRLRPGAQRIIAYVFEGVLVSAIVQIWMLPLLVIYFHRVSPAAVLLNIWVGFILALESFSAVISIGLNSVSPWLAAPLIALTEFLNSLMMVVPTWFADNDLASFRVPFYTGAMSALYYLFGVAVAAGAIELFKWAPFSIVSHDRPRKLAKASYSVMVLGIGLLIVLHPYSAPVADGKLRIDFLDVGQGDSALITFPDGKTMLVDGGGRANYAAEGGGFEPDIPRIGESVVSEFLWERGYSRLDFIVATHSDTDHIQGLVDVARNFDIGALLVGRTPTDDPDFTALSEIARRRNIAITTIGLADEFTVGGAVIRIYGPQNEVVSGERTNNSSIVMKVEFGTRSFLLTGDIEREAEYAIVAESGRHLRADVIKVAHHGSRTSSTDAFVRGVSPETAVVSVGRRSRFGHPHPEVVKRWQNAGAITLTTGEKGTITLSTDGDTIELKTYVP